MESNENSATLIAIPVKQLKVSVYVFTVLTAGITGVVMGPLLIEVIRNSLTLLGISTFRQGASSVRLSPSRWPSTDFAAPAKSG